MQSLDDKLKEILLSGYGGHVFDTEAAIEHDIAQIKQAFADEGYLVPIKKLEKATDLLEPGVFVHPAYMTGQEWYDRFLEEIDKDDRKPIRFLDAARKAAGI